MKQKNSNSTSFKVRISQQDVHYGGNIASGAKVLELFGDAATELLIRHDGDEGLFRAYQSIDFLAPVYAGDFLEISASIVNEGTTSRDMDFTAKKIIEGSRDEKKPSKATLLKEPIIVAKAKGTCVVKK
ncbi:3-aminobutyryl-CoA ammonia lyase [bacterium]|nr:3-aminobutyryl-CoA ammonia lyase [bacterium]